MGLSEVTGVALALSLLAAGTLMGWLLGVRFPAGSVRRPDCDPKCNRARASGFLRRADDIDQDVSRAVEPGRESRSPSSTPRMRDSRDVISAAVAMPCIRNTFSLALGHRLAESARRSDPLSIILIRIDDYSDLCSRYGLKTSNDVLDAAAKFFIASVRAMDWVARFDATTFAFLLPNTTGTQAQGVAERLRIRVAAAHLAADGNQIQMTVSAGVTETSPSDDGDDVLHRAEMALETSIQAGGNQTHCSLGHVAGLVRPSCLSPSV